MQYDAATPAEYLEMLDDDWRREKLLAIREMFLAVPGIEEGMSYKMLGYRRGDAVFGHLNAQKGYVAVYLGELEKLDPGAAIRGTMDCGKSCLRLRKRSASAVWQWRTSGFFFVGQLQPIQTASSAASSASASKGEGSSAARASSSAR